MHSDRRKFLHSLSRTALVLPFADLLALHRAESSRKLRRQQKIGPIERSYDAKPAPPPPGPKSPIEGTPLGVSFVDVVKGSGLDVETIYGGVSKNKYLLETTGCGLAFYDYDNDGWLDVFMVNGWRLEGFAKGHEPHCRLFKNNRDGTFTDVTKGSGLEVRTGWGQACCKSLRAEMHMRGCDPRSRLARDLLGYGRCFAGDADTAIKEAAGGEQFGVQQRGTGGAAHQIVREQREFHVQDGALANAADDGGHAVAGVDVAPRLRTIFFVEHDDRIANGGGQRSERGVDFKRAERFAYFVERSDFFQREADAFKVALEDCHAVAMRAYAQTGVDETSAIPAAQQFLRLAFHFLFFATDERNHVALNVHGGYAGIAGAADGLQGDDKNLFESESIRERF